MADVQCTNDRCPEYQIPKANPQDLPVGAIVCGRCGYPIKAIEEPPA